MFKRQATIQLQVPDSSLIRAAETITRLAFSSIALSFKQNQIQSQRFDNLFCTAKINSIIGRSTAKGTRLILAALKVCVAVELLPTFVPIRADSGTGQWCCFPPGPRTA